MSQVHDAVDQFNAIGGTSARVSAVDTTTAAFRYKGSFGDSVAAIHVGFVTRAKITADTNGKGADGLTSPMYMATNCTPTVTIEFPDLKGKTWSFSSPFALASQGARFYDAGPSAPAAAGGGNWFRPSFLHELLHGFGLEHTATHYALMNHRGGGSPDGGFPWANRPDAEAVRPLPYDIRLLRSAYPGKDTRWDVSVLDTWYHLTPGSKGGAADQVKLCTRASARSSARTRAPAGPAAAGARRPAPRRSPPATRCGPATR